MVHKRYGYEPSRHRINRNKDNREIIRKICRNWIKGIGCTPYRLYNIFRYDERHKSRNNDRNHVRYN